MCDFISSSTPLTSEDHVGPTVRVAVKRKIAIPIAMTPG